MRKHALRAKLSVENKKYTWIGPGADENFVWNTRDFKTYKSIAAPPVDNCHGVAQIVGEGEVAFKFTNCEVTLMYKHAPKFK